jgi:polysaccharide deacetylase 2 family uncharacterized protein YibQ
LKRKRKGGKLTARERFTALLIGGLCLPLFLALFFVFRGIEPSASVSASRAVQVFPPERGGDAAKKTAPLIPSAPAIPVVSAAPAVRPSEKTALKTPPKTVTAAGGLIEERPDTKPEPKPEWNIVYVIDDAGNNLRELEPFLRFPGPLTIAVLPGLPYSARAARMIREAGKEVFLHQPMEAIGGADPGPGAIYTGMSAEEVRAVLEKNVAEIGPVAGINNHQGSKVTEDEAIMRIVLDFCRENKLCFLDSRTTARTSAPRIAGETGRAILERNIFLDNEQDKEAIESYLEQGLDIARKKNTVVMIGHTWSPELAGILSARYAGLSAAGYTFLTASGAVRLTPSTPLDLSYP